MITVKIQIIEHSRPIDTYKISKSNIHDGITNTIEYLQQKGWLDKNVCEETTEKY